MVKKIQTPIFKNCLQMINSEDTLIPLTGNSHLPLVIDTLGRKFHHHLLCLGHYTDHYGQLFLKNIAWQFAQARTPQSLQTASFYLLKIVPLLADFVDSESFEKEFFAWQQEVRASNSLCIIAIDKLEIFNSADKDKGASCLGALLKNLLTDHQFRFVLLGNQHSESILEQASLARLFTHIELLETNDDVLSILKSHRGELESFHHVTIDEASLLDCVALGTRYLNGKQSVLDKSLWLLDSACARISACVSPKVVNSSVLHSIISDWRQIPCQLLNAKLKASELIDSLQQKVFGQDAAISIIALALQYAQIRLTQRKGPVCNFLFAGPAHVGKHHTLSVLTESLFGNKNNLFTLVYENIQLTSGYSDILVSKTVGGYQSLLDAVHEMPYGIFLLENIETAPAKIVELFEKIMVEGVINIDGQVYDFSQAIVVLTTTTGSDRVIALTDQPDESMHTDLMQLVMNPSHHENHSMKEPLSPQELIEEIYPFLDASLPKVLLPYLNVVPFVLLTSDAIHKIVREKLAQLAKHLLDTYQLECEYTKDVVHFLAHQMLDRVELSNPIAKVLDEFLYACVSQTLITLNENPHKVSRIVLKVNDAGHLLRCELPNVTAGFSEIA